jgi:biotin carboxyl carrier protein
VDATAAWLAVEERIHLQFSGRAYTFIDATYAPAEAADGEAADGRIRALSNGRVVAVRVKAGDEVRDGDDLLTVEAMKMEYTHVAPGAAKVARILVEPGQAVATGTVLMELDIEGGPAEAPTA